MITEHEWLYGTDDEREVSKVQDQITEGGAEPPCGECGERIREGQEQAEVVKFSVCGDDEFRTRMLIHAACFDDGKMALA